MTGRDTTFGDRLRAAMTQARIRPSELARRLGVHPVTVTRWRRGEVPDELRLPQLAQCLGVGLTFLKTGLAGSERGDAPPGASEDLARLEELQKRLRLFRLQLQGYAEAELQPGPAVIAAWLEILADLEDARSGDPDIPRPG